MYIDANSVTNAKGKKSCNIEDHSSTGIGLEFTTRDFYSIENVQSQRKLFRLIVWQVKMHYTSVILSCVLFLVRLLRFEI